MTLLFYLYKPYWHLYTELVDTVRTLDVSLKDKELVWGNSLIIDCTLDNMLFLTTAMSIFKDESLVKSLSSDLGFEELLILGDKFNKFKESIDSINKFILKENKVNLKFKESKVIVDDLNTIRSMNSFIDNIK